MRASSTWNAAQLFSRRGEAPQYNTADATLWMFQALDDYLRANRDPDLVQELFPILMSIIHAHAEGTRFGIRVDPADGLLHAGEPGTQLTWMDAKHGDQVFTPRIGKPVEINALWLNALQVPPASRRGCATPASSASAKACSPRASTSFSRFWNAGARCLYDVIEYGGRHTMRAFGRIKSSRSSLPYCASTRQMRAVVDCCGRELLTSHGLRSLSPAIRDISAATGRCPDNAMRPTTWARSGPGCSGPSPGLTTGCTAMRGWRSRSSLPSRNT